MEGQAAAHINATPETVYALVSDVTRMGDWSPETTSAVWVDGATGPAVGAKFKGTNKLWFYKWSTTPTITEAEPGKVFAFDAGGTVWRYEFVARDGGTDVTESFVVKSKLSKLYTFAPRRRQLVRGMETTLAQLKTAAEKA